MKIFIFTMCFLLHLDGILKMNLPFYFMKSITKMETKVRGFTKSQHNIFHQDLNNLLIFQGLNKCNRIWDNFPLYWEFRNLETKYSHNTNNNLSTNLGLSETFENVEINDSATEQSVNKHDTNLMVGKQRLGTNYKKYLRNKLQSPQRKIWKAIILKQ